MQASALLLRWRSYHRARNLRVLIVYFFSLLCCPLCFQGSADSAVRRFPGVWKPLFLRLPSRDRTSSLPLLSLFFFVFYIFSYLLSKTWVAFLGAWCPLPAFRSCFVEFTWRLNVLLINLWGRKCSPHPTPPPSLLLPLFFSFF